MFNVDWGKIKAEYVAGGTSYKALAAKYNISHGQLRKIGADEGWVALRQQIRTETEQKLIEKSSDKQSERLNRIQNVADTLLDQLEKIVGNVVLDDIYLDKSCLKQITGALKDIKDIQMLRAPLDIEEQKARIEKLRKEAEKDGTDKSVTIVLGSSELEEYSR